MCEPTVIGRRSPKLAPCRRDSLELEINAVERFPTRCSQNRRSTNGFDGQFQSPPAPRRLNTPIVVFAKAYGRHPHKMPGSAEAFRMQGFTIRGEFRS
jgi:hypothetical protein